MGNTDSHDDERLIAGAVRTAGRLEPASAQARERVRAAVHAQWRAALAPANVPVPATVVAPAPAPAPAPGAVARRRRWPLALAASVVVAVLSASLLWQSPRGVGATLAVAEVLQGPVTLDSHGLFGARPSALLAGGSVAAGQRVTTGAEGAALLRLGAGLTLRLAANSQLKVTAAGAVSLEAGAAYVDADPRFGAQPLLVTTSLGSVRHLGTQYALSARGGRLEVAVREGLVEVSGSAAGALQRARAGEALVIEPAGAVSRIPVGPADRRWGWLAAVPLPFELDGASLSGFLAWYARETGVGITFTEPGGANRSQQVRLSGSIAGLAPEEALRVVAASSGLVAQRMGDQLTLAFR